MGMLKTATIFIDAEAFKGRKAHFLGVRFDDQTLPSGCIVTGYAAPDGVTINLPTGMSEEMAEQWNKTLEYVNAHFRGDLNSAEKPEGLL